MLSTTIGRLRLVGWLEGSSYLLLLGVAMPVKYIAGHPEMVEVVGLAHGILFVLFCLTATHAAVAHRWPLTRLAGAFISSVLPFGPFIFDARVLKNTT
ncbi:MAG: integral membrane protein [Myxococcota bacterium]|jgi:integral membrane protein